MPCTVCAHPQRRELDLAILTGSQTLRDLQDHYGPSKSSLSRHKQHLLATLNRSRRRLDNCLKQVSLLKLCAILDQVQQGVDTAAAQGELNQVFKGAHVGSRLIHQINRLEVYLDLETVYLLVSSTGFAQTDSLLPAGPEIVAQLHQAVADKTFQPCPEPDPDDLDHVGRPHPITIAAYQQDDAPSPGGRESAAPPAAPATAAPPDGSVDSIPPAISTNAPRNSKLEALRLLQRLCPEFDFTDLSPTPDDPKHSPVWQESAAPPAVSSLSPTANDPENHRDKSGTNPGQTALHPKNINESQQDRRPEKISPGHPGLGLENAAPPATAAAADPPASPDLQTSEPAADDDPWLSPPPASRCSDPPETPNSGRQTALPSEPGSHPCPADTAAPEAAEPAAPPPGDKPDRPPRPIPYRRRDDDLFGFSLYRDLRGNFC